MWCCCCRTVLCESATREETHFSCVHQTHDCFPRFTPTQTQGVVQMMIARSLLVLFSLFAFLSHLVSDGSPGHTVIVVVPVSVSPHMFPESSPGANVFRTNGRGTLLRMYRWKELGRRAKLGTLKFSLKHWTNGASASRTIRNHGMIWPGSQFVFVRRMVVMDRPSQETSWLPRSW